MLKVKPIPFPSFDDWIWEKDCHGCYSWKCSIGHFWFEVEMFSFGRDTITYAFAIADNRSPSNIWVNKVFWNSYEHECPKDEDTASEVARKMDKLRQWYESTTVVANERWRKYIISNYLVEEGDS